MSRTSRSNSEGGRVSRRGLLLVSLTALLVVCVFVSACIGVKDIPLSETWSAITDFHPENPAHLLVAHQRIPRAILAVVVGAALGVAGAIMQALTRNPLAEPGLLGVNAGAGVMIAVGISFFGITSVSGYLWLGMLGAAIAGTGVFFLGGARTGTNPVRLVLAGAALTVVLGALTQVILVNSSDDVFGSYRHWMVGSLAGRGYETLTIVAIVTAVGLALAASLARSLDSAALGEDLSRALGAHPTRVWALAGLTVIILAGAATAAAGPIVFLGLAAPHLSRQLAGVNHRWVLPYSAVLAALLIQFADIAGRSLPIAGEVSVGIMVALLGGPFFVVLVRTRKIAQL